MSPTDFLPEGLPTPLALTVFVVLGVVWIWRERKAAKSGEATAADAIAKAATTLVTPLTARIAHLEEELAAHNNRIQQLENEAASKDAKINELSTQLNLATARIVRLEEQILSLGHVPTP